MNRRNFLSYIGCGCCSFMLTQCGTVPITERRQLKLISESKLNIQAARIYEKIKKKEKMSEDKDKLNEIKEIGTRIEVAISEYFYQNNISDPTSNFNWEYILIDNDKVKNAFCMPGGKIAVFSGILKMTKNTDGLASIMGHEIAHAVAKHSVERASRATILGTVTQLTDIFSGGKLSTINRTMNADIVGLLSHLGIMNPFNRKQESEADYLGLIFSSLAGYDIRETINVWKNMRKANKGKEPAEFLSTHPSSANRIKYITEWMNEIIIKYPPIKKI